jgi:hypothetical protein
MTGGAATAPLQLPIVLDSFMHQWQIPYRLKQAIAVWLIDHRVIETFG